MDNLVSYTLLNMKDRGYSLQLKFLKNKWKILNQLYNLENIKCNLSLVINTKNVDFILFYFIKDLK